MGDAKSWLIFFTGVIAVGVLGISIIAAAATALFSSVRRRASKDHPPSLNLQKSINRFQAIFISIAVLLFSASGAVGALLNTNWDLPWLGGAIVGAFFGLIIGLVASGAWIMVMRVFRPSKWQ